MPHRKPLGTLCRTNCDWDGPPPALGDYLVTPAETWYRVAGIEETARPSKLNLVLERVSREQADAEPAPVHAFHWYERRRRAPTPRR